VCETKTNWREVWDRKAKEDTKDIKLLNGYEKVNISPLDIANKLNEVLKIKEESKVLEIGAGAGMISQFLKCDYIGTDVSQGMCKRHIQLLGKSVVQCEANNIPFKNNVFDIVFAFGVFHYFENKEYAEESIREMVRVSKSVVFVGDIPATSHDKYHLLYNKNEWNNWKITEGWTREARYNAMLDLGQQDV